MTTTLLLFPANFTSPTYATTTHSVQSYSRISGFRVFFLYCLDLDPELPILAVRRKSGVLDDLRHVNGFAKKTIKFISSR